MNPYLYGEDHVLKTRKPYTITKQRERWTEEEHTRFLEALKLYGRAWQRIEEHIGTKTAVQIRSHAQKFFTKLEKEAIVKGAGDALDIEIPPPRPKRKPTNPYPRKTCTVPVLQSGMNAGNSISVANSTLLHENEPKKLYDDEATVAPCRSPSSVDNSSFVSEEPPIRCCAFRKYVPVINESSTGLQEVSVKKELFNDDDFKSSVIMDTCPSCEESLHGEMITEPKQSGTCCQTSITDAHFLGGRAQHFPTDMSVMQSILNQSAGIHAQYLPNTPTPSINRSFLNSNQFFTPDGYHNFLQMQSPILYAGASYASPLLPWFSMGAPAEPSINSSVFSELLPTSQTSDMGAIAAATVAAATAWWTANGFIPLCHRYPGFTCSPESAMPPENVCCQSENIHGEARENCVDQALASQQPDNEFSEAQNLKFESRASSSSEPEASEAEKLKDGLNLARTAEVVNADVLHDSSKFKNRKQLDRSSCGSNTTSGSENEHVAMHQHANEKEEKHIEINEDNDVPDKDPPTTDLSSRRCRSNNNVTDSWKEVSEEGRLAFQALFSREVLPQSFVPSHDLMNKIKRQCSQGEEYRNEPMLKLDGKPELDDLKKKREGLSSYGLGHTAYRTGFKPYKRCSIEAKETTISSSNQWEEKDPKKLRLETQANGCSIS